MTMTADEALRFVEDLLARRGGRLNDLQRIIFRGAWLGKSYKEIHRDCGRVSRDHIMRNVGPELWSLLGQALGEPVSKLDLQGPIERAQQIAQEALSRSGILERSGDSSGLSLATPSVSAGNRSTVQRDWGTVPDVSLFYGRTRELDALEQRIRLGNCRLLAIYGMAGMGKTAMAIKLAQRVQDRFDALVWRSLSRPSRIQSLIADLLPALGQPSGTAMSALLNALVNQRCLIILDGWEAVLEKKVHDGSYCQGYEDYRELLREAGTIAHQSCIILTSREKPHEVDVIEGNDYPVASLRLEGLGELTGRELLAARGPFVGSDAHWNALIRSYSGNPEALSIVAATVRSVFQGDIAAFLEQTGPNPALLKDVRLLLDRAFDRLSLAEIEVLEHLAKQGEPLTVQQILQSLPLLHSRPQLWEVLRSLQQRSLVEISYDRYSLHPLIQEYVLARFIPA